MLLRNINAKGFTLIELLVVISIIGLLSTVALTSLNGVRKKTRDARRLSDMEQIRTALEIYRNTYGYYPANSDTSALPNVLSDNCGGWDLGYSGSGDTFIQPLVTSGIFTNIAGDPVGKVCGTAYRYYRYGAGSAGCDITQGDFYVLGVMEMETSGRPHPSSPGWKCPSRNWQTEFDWVTGSFTK
jgi:prepilin-type N-terminal cleavage/methylation domain-containing protein